MERNGMERMEYALDELDGRGPRVHELKEGLRRAARGAAADDDGKQRAHNSTVTLCADTDGRASSSAPSSGDVWHSVAERATARTGAHKRTTADGATAARTGARDHKRHAGRSRKRSTRIFTQKHPRAEAFTRGGIYTRKHLHSGSIYTRENLQL